MTAVAAPAPSPLRVFASVSRVHIVVIAALGTLTFGWVFTGTYPWLLSAVCALDWFLVNLLNRVVDLPEDRANGIVGTDFVARHAPVVRAGAFGVLFASLVIVHLAMPAITVLRVAFHGLGLIYNWPLLPGHVRIKQLYFLKNAATATGFMLTCFAYPIAAAYRELASGIGLAAILMTGLCFFLFELSYEVIYDLRDARQETREAGVCTFPVVHGERGAAIRIIDGLCVASAVIALVLGFAARVILPWRIAVMAVAPVSHEARPLQALARPRDHVRRLRSPHLARRRAPSLLPSVDRALPASLASAAERRHLRALRRFTSPVPRVGAARLRSNRRVSPSRSEKSMSCAGEHEDLAAFARRGTGSAAFSAQPPPVRVHEAVVEDERERLLLPEHLGEGEPDEDPDLLFRSAGERLEVFFDVPRVEPDDAPVLVHPQAAPGEERFEVWTRALDDGGDEALLDLAAGGVERVHELARGGGPRQRRAEGPAALLGVGLGALHPLVEILAPLDAHRRVECEATRVLRSARSALREPLERAPLLLESRAPPPGPSARTESARASSAKARRP